MNLEEQITTLENSKELRLDYGFLKKHNNVKKALTLAGASIIDYIINYATSNKLALEGWLRNDRRSFWNESYFNYETTSCGTSCTTYGPVSQHTPFTYNGNLPLINPAVNIGLQSGVNLLSLINLGTAINQYRNAATKKDKIKKGLKIALYAGTAIASKILSGIYGNNDEIANFTGGPFDLTMHFKSYTTSSLISLSALIAESAYLTHEINTIKKENKDAYSFDLKNIYEKETLKDKIKNWLSDKSNAIKSFLGLNLADAIICANASKTTITQVRDFNYDWDNYDYDMWVPNPENPLYDLQVKPYTHTGEINGYTSPIVNFGLQTGINLISIINLGIAINQYRNATTKNDKIKKALKIGLYGGIAITSKILSWTIGGNELTIPLVNQGNDYITALNTNTYTIGALISLGALITETAFLAHEIKKYTKS